MPGTELVGGTQETCQVSIVVAELGQHLTRKGAPVVVVLQPLMPSNVSDRAKSITADLPDALGDIVGHREDLISMLVREQVVVAEVAP